MTTRLLLDEMLSDDIARRLRTEGHDVLSVVADASLTGAPDSAVLAHATSDGRAVVTRNIKDFVALDRLYRGNGEHHGGIILVANRTFPQDRRAVKALARALADVLAHGDLVPDTVVFLQR